jgi:hypothetical protein
MIDKKIIFYFLQNVWKCTVFFACAFKVWKDPKKIFLEKYQYGHQKNAEFHADFKKLKAKNHEKMHKNKNTQNSNSFLAIAFLRAFV